MHVEGEFYPPAGVQAMLVALVQRSTQKQVARELGISPQYLNDVIHGRREISAALAKKLGLRKIVLFAEEATG